MNPLRCAFRPLRYVCMRTKPASRMLLVAPLLLAAAASLGGCRAITVVCRAFGGCEARTQELGDVMAPDFSIVVKVENQMDPPADYLVTLRRDGTGEYRVVRRAPTREESSGKVHVLEGKLQQIWDAVRAAEYHMRPERTPDEGDGVDKAVGIQSFSVNANEFPKQVQLVYSADPALAKIRQLVLSTLPAEVFAATSKKNDALASTEVIGDTQTKRFYAPSSPLLKDVPANRRQSFPTYFAAYDFGYQPGPDWRPPAPTTDR